jgi:hypothetical protein
LPATPPKPKKNWGKVGRATFLKIIDNGDVDMTNLTTEYIEGNAVSGEYFPHRNKRIFV